MISRLEEPLPEITDGNEFSEETEEAILMLRKDLKIYNTLQIALMLRKFCSRAAVDEHAQDWKNHDSEEFEEAFYLIVRDMLEVDPTLIKKLYPPDDEIIEMFEERLNILHSLEEKLSHHFTMLSKGDDDLDSWCSMYNKRLMRIIHTHPSLLNAFLTSKDRTPDEQEISLKKIEELLY